MCLSLPASIADPGTPGNRLPRGIIIGRFTAVCYIISLTANTPLKRIMDNTAIK